MFLLSLWLMSFYSITFCHNLQASGPCGAGFFHCYRSESVIGTIGACVDSRFKCDGTPDCDQGEDEFDCKTENSNPCDYNAYNCNNTDICLPMFKKCDGIFDCPSDDDETGCTRASETCNGFTCSSLQCVPHSAKCDNKFDCIDHSDEANCTLKVDCEISKGFFPCENGHCLNHTQVCDGVKHCPDGDDEGGQCLKKVGCKNHNCTQGCFHAPLGPYCFCMEGYELSKDGKSCRDVDECATQRPCDHSCENIQAGFICSCEPGYVLQGKTTCVIKDHNGKLFISSRDNNRHQDHIRSIDLVRRRTIDILSLPESGNKCAIHSFDVDLDMELVYYIHFCMESVRQIHSIKLSNNKHTKVIISGLKLPQDIAVDWVTHNIYIADSGLKQIIACDHEGQFCSGIVKDRSEQIKSIVLNPLKAHMYWSDWSLKSIFESRMDGTARRTLVERNMANPSSLTMDFSTGRLYWLDAGLEKIEYYDIVERQRQELVSFVFTPRTLTLFDRTLYVADHRASRITTYDKMNGSIGSNYHLNRGFRELNTVTLHAYHPLIQKHDSSPCWNRPCSHLCLLAPNKNYTCACPSHMKVASDGTRCISDNNEPYLFVAIGFQLYRVFFNSIGKNVLEPTHTSAFDIVSITYDWESKTIYMFDPKQEHIQAVDVVNDTDKTLQLSQSRMESLTFDPFTNNLYWLDNNEGTLSVSSPGYETSAILLKDLGRPVSMALYQEKSEIYISILGEKPHILKTKMDGKDKSKLQIYVDKPTALFICKKRQRLYFADAGHHSIEYIPLSQENSPTQSALLLKNIGLVSSLAVHSDVVYWTSRDSDEMRYCKVGDTNVYSIPFLHPAGGKIVKPIVYANPPDSLTSECLRNKGGCSHICTIVNNKVTCLCPQGYQLKDEHLCVRIHVTCTLQEFRCLNGEKCILKDWLCDGRPDCMDRSDEQNCTDICGENSFRCKSDKLLDKKTPCIPAHWRCDGSKDCPDESDEQNCSNTKAQCGSHQFSCGDGQCVPISYQCDGGSDCANHADEANCTVLCSDKDKFACDSGKCISHSWYCDGENDCPDKSDERNCPAHKCLSNQFKCSSGACIDEKLHCDRFEDCNDGTDEHNCTYSSATCPPNTFTCSDGHCIYETEICDGFTDCYDGSDEKGDDCHRGCAEDQVKCHNSSSCISMRWLCDGQNDCGDWWDETLPQCREPDVSSTTSKPCKDGSYPCTSGDCVDYHKVCDKVIDCLDGSDEGKHCDLACQYDNANCSQTCIPQPSGPICGCEDGFQLGGDHRTCHDIDECSTIGLCSHICHNKPGSFECSCSPGYKLAPDKKKCKVGDRTAPLLLYMLPNAIRSLQWHDHTEHEILKIDSLSMKGMDYDINTRTIFWTDVDIGTIQSIGYAGSNRRTVVDKLPRPTHLSWDYIGRNFYFVANDANINVCNENGSLCAVILATGHIKLEGFVVSSRKRIMFWSVWSSAHSTSDGRIECADMDGKRRTPIVSYNLHSPTGLTVDPVLDIIYWVDTKQQTLYSSFLNGSGIHRILDYSLVRPLSIAVFEDNIYWSNIGSDNIMKCNKFTGSARVNVHKGNVKAHALRIFHPVMQPEDVNPCQNSSCQHLCLLNTVGYSCACKYGFVIDLDNKTCINDTSQKNDACIINPCLNGGTCVVMDKHQWTCHCLYEYAGHTCEKSQIYSDSYSDNSGGSAGLTLLLITLFIAVFGTITYLIYHNSKPYKTNIFKKSGDKIAVSYRNPIFDVSHSDDEGEIVKETAKSSTDTKSTAFSNPLYGQEVNIL